MPETPTRDALAPGDTQLPDVRGFAVHGLLGRGCIGTTFRATQLATGRDVALKLLHPQLVVLPTSHARMEKLGQVLPRIEHANLTRFGGVGSLPGTRVQFVYADYVEAWPLSQALGTESSTIRQIVDAFCGLLSALAEAHRHGVLHLGLRPGNVLVTRGDAGQRRIQVCDLGLNRLLKFDARNAELPLHLAEHVRYWSPEQLRGDDLDGRADIFGVGTLLYEALTGVPAFEADSVQATVLAVCESEPIAPTIRRAERRIPRELEAVCLRALRRPPEDRFRSPMEMSQALRASLEILARRADIPLGPAFSASPPEPPATLRATLPGDPLPSRASLGLGAILLLLAAGVLYMCTQPGATAQPRQGPPVAPP